MKAIFIIFVLFVYILTTALIYVAADEAYRKAEYLSIPFYLIGVYASVLLCEGQWKKLRNHIDEVI